MGNEAKNLIDIIDQTEGVFGHDIYNSIEKRMTVEDKFFFVRKWGTDPYSAEIELCGPEIIREESMESLYRKNVATEERLRTIWEESMRNLIGSLGEAWSPYRDDDGLVFKSTETKQILEETRFYLDYYRESVRERKGATELWLRRVKLLAGKLEYGLPPQYFGDEYHKAILETLTEVYGETSSEIISNFEISKEQHRDTLRDARKEIDSLYGASS
jgi:hypothetical protein